LPLRWQDKTILSERAENDLEQCSWKTSETIG